MLALLLAYLLIAADDGRWWKWFLGGGLLGLGAITRPNILAFGPVLAVMVLVRARAQAKRTGAGPASWEGVRVGAIRCAWLVFGTGLAIAPVTLRNRIVANERLLISAYGGINFHIANNPQSDGKNAFCPRLDITVRHPGLDMNDPAVRWDEGWQACYLYAAQYLGPRPRYDEVERFFYRITLDYIRQNPRKFLTDTFKRTCWLLNAYEYPNNKDKYRFLRFSSLLRALSWLHFGIIGPIGVVGLVMAVRRRPAGFGYVLAMILSLAVPGVVFVVNARYRLPIVYLLMPAAAFGIVELVKRFRPPVMWRQNLPTVAGLGGLMVFSNLNLFGYRPPYHEYLLFSFAGACGATGRMDLMDETVKEIEVALSDPSRPKALHPWAMSCLFNYFRDRGDLAKAAHYGWLMFQREPVPPPALGALVEVLCKTGRRDEAQKVLEALTGRTGNQASPELAWALLRYGQTFQDRSVLLAAHNLFAALVQVQPNRSEFHQGLAAAKKFLEAASSTNSTNRSTIMRNP